MRNNKEKKDKELYRALFMLFLASVTIGTVVGIGLVYLFSAIWSMELAIPTKILLGFLVGGGGSGIGMGISIKTGLVDVQYEEDFEYDYEDLEDLDEIQEQAIQEIKPTLKIVKGSGCGYSYKHKDGDMPKLEVINSSDNLKKKRR